METACEIVISLWMLLMFCRGLMQAGEEKSAIFGWAVALIVSILVSCLYWGGLYD